ncbi:hypothetical protein ANANG_G00079810 [Anguilla anguilla]|uniref:Uncharacterized protein n=1 Tax=Anguilla anguilla TaxID=7936 RepID=A0A9D3MJX4_ANGAN|nr:hypothetical protein ANANG_G00079810 [Anguilla anguilla]
MHYSSQQQDSTVRQRELVSPALENVTALQKKRERLCQVNSEKRRNTDRKKLLYLEHRLQRMRTGRSTHA